MTKEEYLKLRRFPVLQTEAFETFVQNLRLFENAVFECNTEHGTIRYVRIQSHFEYLLFDIIECTAMGGDVRFPYKRASTRRAEIAERLYEGDWRILDV